MKIVRESIPLAELAAMAEAGFGDLVKAVVDVSAGPGLRDRIRQIVDRLVAR